MGKNQHVVPHNGRWGIKGEGNTKLTSTFELRLKLLLKLVKSQEINSLSYLFMVPMDVLENGIHMVMTHAHLVGNGILLGCAREMNVSLAILLFQLFVYYIDQTKQILNFTHYTLLFRKRWQRETDIFNYCLSYTLLPYNTIKSSNTLIDKIICFKEV